MHLRNFYSSCRNRRSHRARGCLMFGMLVVSAMGCMAPEAPRAAGDAGTAEEATQRDIRITLGKIRRSAGERDGKPVHGVEVKLRLSGPLLSGAKGIGCTLEEVTDATGKQLSPDNDFLLSAQRAPFHPLESYRGLNPEAKAGDNPFDNPGAFEEEFKLEALGDLITVKSLKGHIELIIPGADPANTITASFAKDAGKPLEDAVLKAAGVTIRLQEPTDVPSGRVKSNDVTVELYNLVFTLDDPMKKVGGFEFLNATGGDLKQKGVGESVGVMKVNGETNIFRSFNEKPPRDALLKIYLVSDTSVVKVPFELKDIALE